MNNASSPENGESFIPASQRPDGTWRKARRVKGGYVPQEEVPLYESRAKKVSKGSSPQGAHEIGGLVTHKTIPGLYIEVKAKTKKKGKKGGNDNSVEQAMAQCSISKPTPAPREAKDAPSPTPVDQSSDVDPVKRLKNLRKRLREIEAIEKKILNGTLPHPDRDQIAKVARKPHLVYEIFTYDRMVNGGQK